MGSKYLVKAPFGLRIDILSKGSCCVYTDEMDGRRLHERWRVLCGACGAGVVERLS